MVTAENFNQIENKNLSEDFLNALKELGEAIDSYKERITKIKQSISKIIEIGRQNGISDILIGQYIGDTFEKRELSDSTIQRYLPDGLKRNYNKRNKNFKEIQSSSPVRIEDNSEDSIRIPVPSQTEDVRAPERPVGVGRPDRRIRLGHRPGRVYRRLHRPAPALRATAQRRRAADQV